MGPAFAGVAVQTPAQVVLHGFRGASARDLTAADVRAYAAIMTRDAGADQLRSEGATTVHDVPGRHQTTTPGEAAALFSFA